MIGYMFIIAISVTLYFIFSHMFTNCEEDTGETNFTIDYTQFSTEFESYVHLKKRAQKTLTKIFFLLYFD